MPAKLCFGVYFVYVLSAGSDGSGEGKLQFPFRDGKFGM